jgi:hypothetical protein
MILATPCFYLYAKRRMLELKEYVPFGVALRELTHWHLQARAVIAKHTLAIPTALISILGRPKLTLTRRTLKFFSTLFKLSQNLSFLD